VRVVVVLVPVVDDPELPGPEWLEPESVVVVSVSVEPEPLEPEPEPELSDPELSDPELVGATLPSEVGLSEWLASSTPATTVVSSEPPERPDPDPESLLPEEPPEPLGAESSVPEPPPLRWSSEPERVGVSSVRGRLSSLPTPLPPE
jgi:hypothetical protein